MRQFTALNKNNFHLYVRLMRLDKPIGTFLLLWPTLWALWIAAGGFPSLKNLSIFVAGVILMRSAGCVINDIADRDYDGKVNRTQQRPLATGEVKVSEALTLFVVLCLLALFLVLMTNWNTILLSVVAVSLAAIYPFMKRYTYLPQVVLGAAFGWAIPMAFSAEGVPLNAIVWLLFTANLLWTVAYDTLYALVDRDDDLKAGIKSTAILFGEADKIIIGIMQLLSLVALGFVGQKAGLGQVYYLSLALVACLFTWQHWIIRKRSTQAYFKAFLHNNWVGAVVFLGIFIDYLIW